jgi:hypothetical protein
MGFSTSANIRFSILSNFPVMEAKYCRHRRAG